MINSKKAELQHPCVVTRLCGMRQVYGVAKLHGVLPKSSISTRIKVQHPCALEH